MRWMVKRMQVIPNSKTLNWPLRSEKWPLESPSKNALMKVMGRLIQDEKKNSEIYKKKYCRVCAVCD